MDSGEIAILAVASVATLGPWILEKSGIVLPRFVFAIFGWIAIIALFWGMAKLFWILEPRQLHLVTMSVPGVLLLCCAVVASTAWGYRMFPLETDDCAAFPNEDDESDLSTAHPPSQDLERTALSLDMPIIDLTLDFTDPLFVKLVVSSIGKADVHDLQIQDFRAGGHTISVPSRIPFLPIGKVTLPIGFKVADFGTALHGAIGNAMIDAWSLSRGNRVLPQNLSFPATALYRDIRNNYFRASWRYVFYPARYKKWTAQGELGQKLMLEIEGPYLVSATIDTERLS